MRKVLILFFLVLIFSLSVFGVSKGPKTVAEITAELIENGILEGVYTKDEIKMDGAVTRYELALSLYNVINYTDNSMTQLHKYFSKMEILSGKIDELFTTTNVLSLKIEDNKRLITKLQNDFSERFDNLENDVSLLEEKVKSYEETIAKLQKQLGFTLVGLLVVAVVAIYELLQP